MEYVVENTTALLLNTTDCVCRNKKHRLQAKKLARAFLLRWMQTPKGNSGAHTLDMYEGLNPHQTLLLKEKKVCQRCFLIYRQQLADAHGEQIAEFAISSLCPPV